MKKKLMMVALALGALTLGSCVDDNETASVTAVREATAKQLKSVAAMNRAEAEALKTLANAEVALMQAKAAAEKANAEYDNALAQQKLKQAELLELKKEEQSIENQKRQAQLEQELAQLEVTKKQAQSDLADVEAQMKQAEIDAQTALLTARKELAEAQAELIACETELAAAKTEAERQAILAQREALRQLADAYGDAVTELLAAKADLNEAKATLISLENDLITAQEAKEKAIIDNQNQIAEYQTQIDALKKYTNYTEDVDALKLKRAELVAKQSLLYDDYQAAMTAYWNSSVDWSASNELTDSLKYRDKFSTFANQDAYGWGYWNYGYGYYKDGDRWIDTDDVIRGILDNSGNPLLASQYYSSYKYYYYESSITQSRDGIGIRDSIYVDFPTMPDFRGAVEFQIEDRKAEFERDIKDNEDRMAYLQRWYNGEATKADYTGVSTDTERWANLVDSAAYLQAKYEAETEETAKAAWRDKYQEVLTKELDVKNELEWRTNDAESLPQQLADFLDQWDMLKNYADYQQKLQEAIDQRNDMRVEEYAERVAAWYDYMEKRDAYWAVQSEIDAIDVVLNGDGSNVVGADYIASQIKSLEEEIASLEAKNENYSKIETKEEAVAMQQDIVDAYEAVVKALEIIANQAKAELDAAMAKYEATEE